MPHAPAPDQSLKPGARPAPHALWRGIHQTLRQDTVGGALLLGATLLALVLSNSALAERYEAVRGFTFGPAALHLDLSVSSWAADGLLAIFFFVVGLELKEELVAGKLRDPRRALVPVAAALGGVAVPALVYLAVAQQAGPEALRGWAIPAATDIAFAVAVLAVVGRHLPVALRTFLLTLAVVDDLAAISIIALVYTDEVSLLPLGLALLPLAVFAVLVQRGIRAWWLLIPLAVTTWALVHASGVHATVAGVLLGFAVPVLASERARVTRRGVDGELEHEGLAAHFADRWSVLSGAVAVPVFAFFSAGVTVGGLSGLLDSLRDPIAAGIVVGLVLGKSVGITGAALLVTRLPGVRLDPDIRVPDLFGLSFVAGIGFTVALLVGELSFGAGTDAEDAMKVGVLVGSLLAALVGGTVLGLRSHAGRIAAR